MTPTCAGQLNGQDGTFFIAKCPTPGLNVDTCSRNTGATDTVLQINAGSIDLDATRRCVRAPTGRAIACNDDAPCALTPNNLGTSAIANAGRGERGIFTIAVTNDTGTCGFYGLNSSETP